MLHIQTESSKSITCSESPAKHKNLPFLVKEAQMGNPIGLGWGGGVPTLYVRHRKSSFCHPPLANVPRLPCEKGFYSQLVPI